jgi:hypothetical protein
MNSTKQAKLTKGPVGRTLVSLTIPMLLAVLTMVIFNLVDTAFVGRLSTQKLAAISFTFPVILVIGSLAQGLGIGASGVISQAIGRGGCDRRLAHCRRAMVVRGAGPGSATSLAPRITGCCFISGARLPSCRFGGSGLLGRASRISGLARLVYSKM